MGTNTIPHYSQLAFENFLPLKNKLLKNKRFLTDRSMTDNVDYLPHSLGKKRQSVMKQE
jgi:hypothetical protein